MKSYSKLEILKNKFQEESKSLWQFLKEPKFRYIEVEIPYYDYLRGNVLIADIRSVVEGCPVSLDIDKLIYLLYIQFLYQVKKGISYSKDKQQGYNLETIGHKLVGLRKGYQPENLVKTIKKETFNQLSPNTWVFEEQEEVVSNKPASKPTFAYLTLRMKTEEVYRGEVLLNDLNEINPSVDIHVEELISLLYIDFIKKIKREGNDERVLRSIVTAYEHYKDYY